MSICVGGKVFVSSHSTILQSENLIQIQSHSPWINDESNNFPAMDVLPWPHIPLYVSLPLEFYILAQCFFLLPLYCLCSVDNSDWPSGHLGCGVWIKLSNHCRGATHTNTFTGYSDLISFCVAVTLCVVCNIVLPWGTLMWQQTPQSPVMGQPQTKPVFYCTYACKHIHPNSWLPFSPIPNSFPPLTSIHFFYVFWINSALNQFHTFPSFLLKFKLDSFTVIHMCRRQNDWSQSGLLQAIYLQFLLL